MITLYQFPISHYCEKIRWALDYKNIGYEIKNLLPGLHLSRTRKLAPDTCVPILVDSDRVIQGSDSIITYLDETYAGQSLTPVSDQLKSEALEWEQYVDREVGIHVRRCCYHVLLEHPDLVIPFFTHQGPWYGKLYLHFVYPKLKKAMRKFMNINQESEQRSRQRLGDAIDKLHDHLQENDFLAGDQFSRADLSAASLLAPLCMPAKYGLNWPDQLPPEFEALVDGFQPKLNWVNDIYARFR